MHGSDKRYLDNTNPFFSAGLTIRQKEPKNLEAPFDRIDSYLTPTELFYIRSHFPTPKLDRASYQLRIDGAGSAMRNGRACPCEHCWSVPVWQKTLARSCSKERIAEYPKKSPVRPGRSRMFGACR